MNKTISILTGLCGLSGFAAAFTVEALPTHNIFYAGLNMQPCLRVKVTAAEGETLSQMVFTTGDTTSCANIAGAHLYQTAEKVFAEHATAAAFKVTKVADTQTPATSGQLTFTPGSAVALSEGDNYFWLVYDVASGAKGNNKISGRLTLATDGDGNNVQPTDGMDGSKQNDRTTAAVPAKVFPFKYRIAPYVRPKWAISWNRGMFTKEHLKYMTDWINFGFTHSDTDVVAASDAVISGHDYTEESLALARSLRGSGSARILAGFSCAEGSNPMSAIINDATKRRTLATNMAKLVKEKGYEGIDIDWEYPKENKSYDSGTTWTNFARFLGELREVLAGTGASISLAVTTRYDAPTQAVLDSADFINSMSYGRPGEHSTKDAAQTDVNFLVNKSIPKVKIILGLPFFSRDVNSPHSDQGGVGYSTILKWYPKIGAAENYFVHPTTKVKHFFNGANLIKDKCKTFVISQGCGGVCIWAYDTDVALSNSKSLSKALYSVIKQTKR